MVEPRKSQEPARGGPADKTARKGIAEVREEIAEAREEIAEAREEIAETREGLAETQEGLDVVGGMAFAAAAAQLESAAEESLDPISEKIENEIKALGDNLSPQQRQVLADLIRLHLSLRGPQDLLETSGNFSRPVFPPYPPVVSRRSR